MDKEEKQLFTLTLDNTIANAKKVDIFKIQ
jgi:hypothetical protein